MDLNILGREPIPGPTPTGQDARYDPEYDQLQGEIDKLTSVTNLSEVSWKRVVETASSILATKSKDLLAAVYMSVGLQHEIGLEGLATGSQVLRDMVATYWDDCFPPKKRLRGRMNAFSWWEEKTVAWLKDVSPDPVPGELHRTILENLTTLDTALGDLLPDLPPLRDLLSAVKRLPVVSVAQEERPPGDPEETGPGAQPESQPPHNDTEHPGTSQKQPSKQPQPASPASAQDTATSAATAPAEDVASARKALVESARAFAELGAGERSTDPWVWKAARMAAWISVKAVPPSQGGQTMIPAPDGALRAALRKQLGEGRFREAAVAAERHFPGAIFWFDLQQIVTRALEALGDDYAQALHVVRGELRDLLERFPGLEQLSFADGTPFADAETRAWISTLSQGGDAARVHDGPVSCQDPSDDVLRVLELSETHFAKKDEPGALDVLTRAMRAAPDGPSRLHLRVAQVELLSRAGRFTLASALAEELVVEVEHRDLAVWIPDLAVRVLQVCHDTFIGQGGEDNIARARDLAKAIGRIKPSAALNLQT